MQISHSYEDLMNYFKETLTEIGINYWLNHEFKQKCSCDSSGMCYSREAHDIVIYGTWGYTKVHEHHTWGLRKGF